MRHANGRNEGGRGMKVWVVAVASLLAGSALGAGTSWWRGGRTIEDYKPLLQRMEKSSSAGPSSDGTASGKPIVEVVGEGADHDFGVMGRYQRRSHVFILKNSGTADLRVRLLKTTCKCTLGKLDKDVIPPGQTLEVQLEWKANSDEAEFRQSATLETNDIDRSTVILTVHGRLDRELEAIPSQFAVGRIGANESRVLQLQVFGHMEDPLNIRRSGWSESDIAQFFSLEQRGMTSEEIAAQPRATSGVVISVKIIPGLPLGAFQQSLRLFTDRSEDAFLEVPMSGTIVSDLSVIAGSFYDVDRQLIRLGNVSQRTGKSVELHVMVKGEHRQRVRLQIAEVRPEWLRVKVGEPQPLREGRVIRYPVTVEVPVAGPLGDFSGTPTAPVGRVVFQSGIAEIPPLPIHVRFVVGE